MPFKTLKIKEKTIMENIDKNTNTIVDTTIDTAIGADVDTDIDPTIELLVSKPHNTFSKEVLQKYYNEGFRCGPNSVGGDQPMGVKDGLAVVRGLFIQDSEVVTKMRMKVIGDKIVSLKETEKKHETEITECGKTLVTAHGEKENLEKERDDLMKDSKNNTDTSKLIVLGVSFGLFTFLVIAAYYYIGRATVTPILKQALGVEVSVNLLSWLFPIVALGFGVVFHKFLDLVFGHDKKIWARVGGVLGALAILGVALWLDVVMGTEMSKQAHIKELNLGHTRVEWSNDLVWSDNRFYVVLLLGFVSYLVWGILLYALVSLPHFAKNSTLKVLDSKIKRACLKIANIESVIKTTSSLVNKIKKEIGKLREVLGEYESGAISFSESDLDLVLGRFMLGYSTYITGYYYRDADDGCTAAAQARQKKSEVIKAAESDRDAWKKEMMQNHGRDKT